VSLTITRTVTVGTKQATTTTIMKRLWNASRDVYPVVVGFKRALQRSIKTDFEVGGRPPYNWARNARNTVAVKGHARPLIGKKQGGLGGIYKATHVLLIGFMGDGKPTGRYLIDVSTSEIGAFHQAGWAGKVIRPRNQRKKSYLRTVTRPARSSSGRFQKTKVVQKIKNHLPQKLLWFQVAEDHKVFTARRRKALKSRRAGKATKVPSRAAAVWVCAKKVRHPGYKARRFVVVRESLIARYWRAPMRDYIVDGKMPER